MQWIPIWKKAPFIRLLIPFCLAIMCQWYLPVLPKIFVYMAVSYLAGLFSMQFLPIALQFKLGWITGLLLNLLIFCVGLIITHHADVRTHAKWFKRLTSDSDRILLTVNEPLSLKANSYKTIATINGVLHGDTYLKTEGRVLIYFSKDSSCSNLRYGDLLMVNKYFQSIINPGNPGGFDYKQYCAFKQIYHQVYLKPGEYTVIRGNNGSALTKYLVAARNKILSVLQQNMVKDDQLSMAEALLIGYTDDLDKDLVQAYSNTGVVHIIAISGMHIGLVYMMLLWIFKKIPVLRKIKVLKVLFLLTGIWLFALLTGGCPSILRAAVMFSFIIIGESLSKRSSIYNSLGASAFMLLCYNPYFLWDVGFQLSYLALAGIVIFQKPVFNLFYFKNKLANKVWELTAVSIAAQILTFPICLYYFHQFPLLFLFTNIISVPLSSIILFVEILFIGLGWLPFAGYWFGKVTWMLILVMNKVILFFNSIPNAVLTNISISCVCTILIYIFVLGCAYWLIYKSTLALKLSLLSMAACFINISRQKWILANQKKIIVYNVPHHCAVDFIKGNSYLFVGDSSLSQTGTLQNYNLKTARVLLQLSGKLLLPTENKLYVFENKTILLLDSTIHFLPSRKMNIDVVIVSRNPKITISQIASVFNCKNIVLDASNNLWKIANWKKECDGLHLPCHSIPGEGPFILDL